MESGELMVRHCRVEDPVVTGDWVALRNDLATIEATLPRQSRLSRKAAGKRMDEQILAANVDVAFLVMGLDGDFNVRRLERYLWMCRHCGVRPVVVLNKSDLCEAWADRLAETEAVSSAGPVLLMSALHNQGVAQLSQYVETGETAALLGSSGAGKSTLLNRLRGFDCQRTQAVREGDSRGRHTTTQRELLLLEQGWLLMDLPGLREIQPWGDSSQLGGVFGEIDELARQCRFRDCSHHGEPGCAVTGGVDAERLESYHRLMRESAWLERRTDAQAQAAEKARWKSIHKAMRHLPKKF